MVRPIRRATIGDAYISGVLSDRGFMDDTQDPTKTPDDREARFARAFRDTLEQVGLTQTRFAELMEVGQSTVSQWVNGRVTPRPLEIFEIEHALGLPGGTLSQHLGFVPVGVTSDRAGFAATVRDDPLLMPEEKSGLLAYYRAVTRGRIAGAKRRRRQD